MRFLFLLMFAALIPSSLFAQASKTKKSIMRPKTGSVEGDVYVMMKSGDTKKGSGLKIRLVSDKPDLRDAMARICTQEKSENGPLLERYQLANSAKSRALADGNLDAYKANLNLAVAYLDSMTEVTRKWAPLSRATFDAAIVAETTANIDAHYKFMDVNPGTYILSAEWTVGTSFVGWTVPITVQPGSHVLQDLTNDARKAEWLNCRTGLAEQLTSR